MKQKIPKEDGRLKYLCNEIHFFIADKINGRLTNRAHRALATTEGLVAGYVVAWGGESLVNLANQQEANINLETLAYMGLSMVAGVGVATRIAPRYYRQFLENNPIYSRGVIGVMTGASAKALETLLF